MMKKISFRHSLFLLIAILAIAVMSGCYNKKADLIIPNNDCDTTIISYRSDIINILPQNCYMCHSADKYATAGGNYQLDMFSPLQGVVTNGKL